MSELTCWKWTRSLGSPGITADMLEIVLGLPSTKEKVLKTVPAPHDIKFNMPETVSGLLGVIQDIPETIPPSPRGSSDIGAEGCPRPSQH